MIENHLYEPEESKAVFDGQLVAHLYTWVRSHVREEDQKRMFVGMLLAVEKDPELSNLGWRRVYQLVDTVE